MLGHSGDSVVGCGVGDATRQSGWKPVPNPCRKERIPAVKSSQARRLAINHRRPLSLVSVNPLHTRLRRWAADGTFARMRQAAQANADAGRLQHRPCPPARRRGTKRGLRSPALARSRGGLTSKLHLACDGAGRPLAFTLPGGKTDDCTQFTAVRDAIRVPRSGPGRPRTRPDHVIGDKGYSSKAIRTWVRRRGIAHTVPERADQITNRARRGSLPPTGPRPPDPQAPRHRGRAPSPRFIRIAASTVALACPRPICMMMSTTVASSMSPSLVGRGWRPTSAHDPAQRELPQARGQGPVPNRSPRTSPFIPFEAVIAAEMPVEPDRYLKFRPDPVTPRRQHS